MYNIVGSTGIQGHRIVGGVCRPVTKIWKTLSTECTTDPDISIYSDGGTATQPALWVEGPCPKVQYDYEKEVLCEKGTGRKVVLESWTDIDDPSQTPTRRQTYINGDLFTGSVDEDLENCASVTIESDPKPMCDNGTNTFLRRYVKQDGVPTDEFFDRTFDGGVYVPTGTISFGACRIADDILTPYAFIATNANPVTIPAGIKGFSINNLGVNQEGSTYTDIVITGGLTYTMLGNSVSKAFKFNADDGAILNGNITVTPEGLGVAEILYVL